MCYSDTAETTMFFGTTRDANVRISTLKVHIKGTTRLCFNKNKYIKEVIHVFLEINIILLAFF